MAPVGKRKLNRALLRDLRGWGVDDVPDAGSDVSLLAFLARIEALDNRETKTIIFALESDDCGCVQSTTTTISDTGLLL